MVTLLGGVLASDVGVTRLPGGCKTATATGGGSAAGQADAALLGFRPSTVPRTSVRWTKPVVVVDGKITSVALSDDWGNYVDGAIGTTVGRGRPPSLFNFARSYMMTVNSKSTSGCRCPGPPRSTPSCRTTTCTLYRGAGRFRAQPPTCATAWPRSSRPISTKPSATRSWPKHMIVRTDPPVQGSWNWISDSVAQWRPENYYPAGTRIDVDLNVFGLKLGDGLYGQTDAQARINIGASHLRRQRHHQAGECFRQRAVGAHHADLHGSWRDVDRRRQGVHWWTPPGIYSVLDKGEVVTMNSATYGIPLGTADSYNRKIGWATRISTDGVYGTNSTTRSGRRATPTSRTGA